MPPRQGDGLTKKKLFGRMPKSAGKDAGAPNAVVRTERPANGPRPGLLVLN
jgi:hypothetical protein